MFEVNEMPEDLLAKAKAITWFIRECHSHDSVGATPFNLSSEAEFGLCTILDHQHTLIEQAHKGYEAQIAELSEKVNQRKPVAV